MGKEMNATKKAKKWPRKVSTYLMPESHRQAKSQAALIDMTLEEWIYSAILEKIKRDK